jgi:hypothetical protein
MDDETVRWLAMERYRTLMSIKLVELYRWSAGAEYTGTVDRQKKKILFFIDNLKCRNLKLGKMPRADIQRSRQAAHRENYQELQSARNTANIRVRIPEDAQHTYDGSILSISHYFKIYLYTRAFTHNPSIKIPLNIGYAPPRRAALL